MAIYECLKAKNPYMLAVIFRIYCLGPYKGMNPPEKVDEEPDSFYKRLMEEVPGFARE